MASFIILHLKPNLVEETEIPLGIWIFFIRASTQSLKIRIQKLKETEVQILPEGREMLLRCLKPLWARESNHWKP